MATWDQVQRNPTLYQALPPSDGARLRWHDDADREHSSQVFCVSAFGTLRQLPVRDRVIRQLLGRSEPPPGNDPTWTVDLEVERPKHGDLVDDIGSLSYLGKLRNIRKSDAIPADYFKDVSDEELSSYHLIGDRTLLSPDRFEDFVKARREAVVVAVKEFLRR